MTREITTRTGKQWLGDDGIVRQVVFPGAEQTLADAVEHIRAIAALMPGGRRGPLLVDLRGTAAASREARAYFAGPETAKVVSAVALLVGSPISSVIGNFFLRLNQPRYPTRLFTDEAEALPWLKGFLP